MIEFTENPIKLSLCAISLNESKNVKRMFESVKGLVNEILVMDTGSEDDTVELVKKHGGNIIPYNLKSFDFASARNQVLKYALGDWVLHLDFDEELTAESRKIIREIIQSDKKEAYKCTIRSKMPNGEIEDISSIRLFKNEPNLKYYGKAHEQLYPSLRKKEYDLKDSEIIICHHGYDVSEQVIKSKLIRNAQLLVSEFSKSKHWVTAHQLSQSYAELGWDGLQEKYYNIYLELKPLS